MKYIDQVNILIELVYEIHIHKSSSEKPSPQRNGPKGPHLVLIALNSNVDFISLGHPVFLFKIQVYMLSVSSSVDGGNS